MTPISVSIISTFLNFGLGLVKIFFGLVINSIGLIADGIHSGLDVLSSFVTYLGLKTAKKPVDEKYKYGYFKAESLAGFLVAILLAITGILILKEGISRFFGEEMVKFSPLAIFVLAGAIVINEGMARLKFYYGRKFQSLALVADAEHSRADVLSSIGVLIGLFIAPFFSLADALAALVIGGYILFETVKIGKEVTENLLDVSNKEIEERIKKICVSHKIEISFLRTRKIGPYNFAEIKIKLPPKLKVEEVQQIVEILEERILANIPEIKELTISIEAYEMSKTVVLPRLGKKIGELKGFERIGPSK